MIRTLIVLFWTALIFAVLSWNKLFVSDNSKTLNIFTWGGIFTDEMISTYEKKNGIKINLNYYTTNEELIVKLKTTGGKGYDIVIPSDYAVKILKEENLLQPLDRAALTFLSQLNPLLLGHDFDIQNTYSIPIQWSVYGLAYSAIEFPKPPTWNDIFTKRDYKIAMTNDPTEALNFAAFYLFGPQTSLSPSQTTKVARLLNHQRSWVEAYTTRGDYQIATKNSPIAILPSAYYFPTASDFPNMRFTIPSGWGFISIENVCIVKNSKKQKLISDFLNYLYLPENEAAMVNAFYQYPPTKRELPNLTVSQEFIDTLRAASDPKYQFYFFRHLIPEPEIRDIWIKVKS